MGALRRIVAWPIEAVGCIVGLIALALCQAAALAVGLSDRIAGRELDVDL